ncbi:MAG: hypothetical protein GEU80_16300 [Dehalococcoidia bacterium]|nr:hypothetical protein [Dehalococcoidia bacterium]
MGGICDDLRVIELSSGAAGGLATMVLADFGADVIKVEPPDGDPARDEPAAPMWLRGKRSVVLDLGERAGRERLRALTRGADVVVASYVPGDAEEVGADYDTLRAENAGLIYCSITAWGPRGRYARYPTDERVVAAKSGRMQAFSGISQREGPSFTAVRTGTHAAAQSAVFGILAAAFAREQTGEGQLVETSLLQATFPYDLNTLLRTQLQRRFPELLANDPYAALTLQSMPTLGYQPLRGSDGRWIQMANLLEHLFLASLEALELTAEVLGNPRYSGVPRLADREAMEEVRNMMLERARQLPTDELMRRFRENPNVAADLVGTAQAALEHADLLANEEVVDVDHPRLGSIRQLGLLARLTETPGQVGTRAPEVGADTDAVLAEPARTPSVPPTANGRRPRHPLEGITVLEFATIIATPLAGSVLADVGARVIKVEPVRGGDPMRGMGVGLGAHFVAAKTTAGKESICLNLKSEQGMAVVRDLVARADVILHNYRPGVPERLGIGYEQAREVRPDIIWVSANGYGPAGPGARRPSAHPVPGAVNGGALLQSGAAWPPPVDSIDDLREASRRFFRANEANPDPNTAMAIASATLLGLQARRRTSKGQRIFVSMLGANAYANFDDFLSYEGKRPRSELDPELRGTEPTYRLYRAADGWVFLDARGDDDWRRFCALVERPGLASDVRFATAAERQANGAALGEALDALFGTRPALEWEHLLVRAGVACVEASSSPAGAFFVDDEHMAANGFAPLADHALWGEYQRWGATVKFSGTPERCGPGVLAGQNTDALLRELGRSEAEVAALRRDGIVDSATPMDLGLVQPQEAGITR